MDMNKVFAFARTQPCSGGWQGLTHAPTPILIRGPGPPAPWWFSVIGCHQCPEIMKDEGGNYVWRPIFEEHLILRGGI